MSDNHASNVQAELQRYLTGKNINSLFILIVENLLIDKPANPIGFIIEYLHKQYPEESMSALRGIADKFAGANRVDDRADSKTGTMTGSSAKLSDAKFKSDSENDEDDHLGDLLIIPAVGPVSEGRRISVSAQSVDPGQVKHQRSLLVIVEKTRDVTERLLQVVRKSPLLRALDEEQIQMIVKTFTGPIIKVADDIVIEQGDIGDAFYLLEEGSVDVFVQKKGQADRKQVHSYKAGDSFGELAIMYNAPRAATCIAHGDCKLWALDRNSFRAIVVAAAMHKRELYSGFLSRVPILQTLTEMEIMTLADALREEQFVDGEAVCHQGDDGDYFYIIKSGTAICAQEDSNGKDKIVATLTTGHYFGEIALLTSKPRQATVRASGSLNVLTLERATFTRVFGNLDEIMKRNMEEYNKYAASGI